MLLTVRDAAKLIGESESQIYRWVDEGAVPYHRVNDQVRFHRAELLEWATTRRKPVSPEMFHDDAAAPAPGFAEALSRGGVHYQVEGSDRETVLRAVAARLPLDDDIDRELLLDVLVAREALGTTAIGDGIAIPHVRNPTILAGLPATVTLCFLEHTVPFGAPDGQPVSTIFSLLSPTIKGHLQMLAKLSWALHDPAFRAAVVARAPAEKIFAEAERVEHAFPHRGEAR